MPETLAILTRGNSIVSSWDGLPPTVALEDSDDDDDIPDLMDDPQDLSDDQKKALQVLNRTVQPFIRFTADFQLLHNVPTEQHIPNRGNLMSPNPLSSISQSANSIIQSNNTIQEVLRFTDPVNRSSMQPTPQVYWSVHGIDSTDLPERIMKRTIQRALAINSPNLTRRFYHHRSTYAHLSPMNEVVASGTIPV